MRILVVGQVPPPYHGSNVMTRNLLNALDLLGHEVSFVNKSFSRKMSEIRKLSLHKLIRIPSLIWWIIKIAKHFRPRLCIYFLSIGSGAFIIDTFLLWIIRRFRIPYILRFGAKGFRNMAHRSAFRKFLFPISSISSANFCPGFAVFL